MQEQFAYAYDKAWNLNDRTNNALIQSFTVNNVNELSGASQAGTLTVGGTAGEPNGNVASPGVTSVMVNGQSASLYEDGSFAAPGFSLINGQTNFTAVAQDHDNRLSTNSVTVNVLGGASYTYDSNGNLLSDGTRNFVYNDENELIAVWVASSWSNSFAYDGLMRKRIEQDFGWNGSGWAKTNEVHYVYDGNLVLQERDKNNEPLTTYTRGVDLSGTLEGAGGIGGLLARSDNQKIVPAVLTPEDPSPQNVVTSYYFSDDQGNVTALVSPSGIVLEQYEYDPFGNLISKNGLMADINKYRFSSKEWEGNSGLYYYGYRFYDPNLQRWVSRDPIQEMGGLNLFEFVDNSPIDYDDTYGLVIMPPGWQGPLPSGGSYMTPGGPIQPNGQPAGLPPGNWVYQPDQGNAAKGIQPNSRGGRWYQPGKTGDASWDQNPKGKGGKCGKPHWDVKTGKPGGLGNSKVDENGNPVSQGDAHPGNNMSQYDWSQIQGPWQNPIYQPAYNPYAQFYPGLTPPETLTLGGL